MGTAIFYSVRRILVKIRRLIGVCDIIMQRTFKNIAKIIWGECRIYLSNHIVSHIPFHFIRLAFYRNIMNFRIGKGSSIHLGAWTDTPRFLCIGDSSVIGQNCRLDSRGGITIGNRVSIAADCVLLTGDHDVQSETFEGRRRPITIGDYVFVGTRAIILPGVGIGEGAVIGTGSVVARDVAPYAIVAGVPAKVIAERNRKLGYDPSYKRWLH